jgi:hypothetical protein
MLIDVKPHSGSEITLKNRPKPVRRSVVSKKDKKRP